MINASVSQINDYYVVWGIRLNMIEDNKEIYELFYLPSFGNKKYKTKENAIKAINKKGYTFVDNSKLILSCWN